MCTNLRAPRENMVDMLCLLHVVLRVWKRFQANTSGHAPKQFEQPISDGNEPPQYTQTLSAYHPVISEHIHFFFF